MIELSTTTVQTIQPGGSVTFERVRYQSRRSCECFNDQLPNSVKLCSSGVYLLLFSGVVTPTEADTQLQMSLAVGGTPLPNTNMDVKPVAVGDLWSINAHTLYANRCCDADRVTVVNTGAVPLAISPGATLTAIRQA